MTELEEEQLRTASLRAEAPPVVVHARAYLVTARTWVRWSTPPRNRKVVAGPRITRPHPRRPPGRVRPRCSPPTGSPSSNSWRTPTPASRWSPASCNSPRPPGCWKDPRWSANRYARRYQLAALVGLAGDDDDAQAAQPERDP